MDARAKVRCNFDADAAHEFLKAQFLASTLEIENVNTGKREKKRYVRSSAKLNTMEFNEYLDKVAQFLAEWCGIIVQMLRNITRNQMRRKWKTKRHPLPLLGSTPNRRLRLFRWARA